jgi:Cd2+/Zn2+-exporting ATPase
VESFPPGREQEVAALAFALERLSSHPLARAITRYGKQQRLIAPEIEHFHSVTGLGLEAHAQGRRVRLGKRDWLVENEAVRAVAEPGTSHAGLSEVWLEWEGLVGRLVLRDDIRPAAGSVVAELRQRGLPTVVLTGDHRPAAEHLKIRLGLDDVRFDLKPEQKVAVIQDFTLSGRRVAMIGDGVNDAPSLAVAHVGVAMGARGSDAALEQAEVVLMHDRLENFLLAFRLSQRARRVIRQNVAVSLGTVVVLVAFALAGGIPLTVGILGHEGSTVLVVLNSLRLLFTARQRTRES